MTRLALLAKVISYHYKIALVCLLEPESGTGDTVAAMALPGPILTTSKSTGSRCAAHWHPHFAFRQILQYEVEG